MIIGPLFPLTSCPQQWTVFLEGNKGPMIMRALACTLRLFCPYRVLARLLP